jgi:hypothetical protein
VTAGLAFAPSKWMVRGLDLVVGCLVIVFAGLGVLAGIELTRLAGFSTSLLNAATALDQVGRSLAVLARVPFVGPGIGPLAASVQQTAASTRVNAAEAVSSVHMLAIVVGVAVAVGPLVPLLGGYLPLRVIRFRRIRALRRGLAARPVEPQLLAYLAHGAVSRLPYARLRQIAEDPWGDLLAGRHRELAAAELRRLGIALPNSWRSGLRAQPPVAGRRER